MINPIYIYITFFVLGFVYGYRIYKWDIYVYRKLPNFWSKHSAFGIMCVVLANKYLVWPSVVSSDVVLSTLTITFCCAYIGIHYYNIKQFFRCIERKEKLSNIKKIYESLIWTISRNGQFDRLS